MQVFAFILAPAAKLCSKSGLSGLSLKHPSVSSMQCNQFLAQQIIWAIMEGISTMGKYFKLLLMNFVTWYNNNWYIEQVIALQAKNWFTVSSSMSRLNTYLLLN